jgi:aspartate racemase
MSWKSNDGMVLGIVGGMGSYATLNFYNRILNSFPAERDWERPRVIIDNYSTLPSRVRAILYNENVNDLEVRLSKSIASLLLAGATDVVLACHTSHYFLQAITDSMENEERDKILNLIELAKSKCVSLGIKKVRLLASEGTIQAGIYEKAFGTDIDVIAPNESGLGEIRMLIEAVKQNKVTDTSIEMFRELVESSELPVILGCSELPVLKQKCDEAGMKINNKIIDPLQSVIDIVVDKYNQSIIATVE